LKGRGEVSLNIDKNGVLM